MEIEAQQKLSVELQRLHDSTNTTSFRWHKRIRKIQALCCLIIVAYSQYLPGPSHWENLLIQGNILVNKKLAVAGLCWLIYWTFNSEVESMLKPPTDFTQVYDTIDHLVMSNGRNEVCLPSCCTFCACGLTIVTHSLHPNQDHRTIQESNQK